MDNEHPNLKPGNSTKTYLLNFTLLCFKLNELCSNNYFKCNNSATLLATSQLQSPRQPQRTHWP